MKFTVEVEDFWLEEEELTEALVRHIKHDVVTQIAAKIKTQTEEQITKKVKEVVDGKITLVIDEVLSELVDTSMITVNREEVSIADNLKRVFMEHHGWANPDKKMQKIAKEFGEELKLQYNNAFANKIVLNMKEQGLLKDEVVQILLGGDGKV